MEAVFGFKHGEENGIRTGMQNELSKADQCVQYLSAHIVYYIFFQTRSQYALF